MIRLIGGLCRRVESALVSSTAWPGPARICSDGGGTIQFGRATPRAPVAGWPTIPGTPRTPVFEHIDDVYDVYKTILTLQGSGKGERR
jgi:hypothetical protein